MEKEKNKRVELRPLTKEEEEQIDSLFRSGREDEKISELPTAEVNRGDVHLLKPGRWLNDEVINFYMEILKIRQKNNPNLPKCHFFGTFFYTQLCNGPENYDFSKVKRWTNKVDIFSLDKVILPVHLGNHWCCAVINFKDKQFQYFDSLLGDNRECLKKLRRYVADEMVNRSKQGIVNLDEFKDSIPKDIPIQSNGYDCGVFMCKYAEFSSRGSELNFTQKDITQYRRRIALELYLKKILD
ncbi:hypothetical protein DICPUDRAFT_55498 [Dictyostelium purpureum]|uniref:Ubiquitin-like protease family profile domain-containing protein n=1 Tax=Dictyostelium purpureum TaxID=5786 RepID=F0ZMD7_DICPU|nr:uncharacterized protein DICPUDRAFT_55498 [Dictyostelium purpureum]EGC34898.1 hypothetical protein DICPUDRAFT_55498 [Dictyostelium purpureum]|eukprot:XP_003288590.1 hypothetical protein DICPUDRAFT_55498 [Dictyostelium purpureum]